MSLFDSTLQKIADRLFGEAKKKELIATVISKEIKQTLTPDQLTLRDGKLYITANPTIKAVIALRKGDIITSLNKEHVSIQTIV
jgi:hypothetical protein